MKTQKGGYGRIQTRWKIQNQTFALLAITILTVSQTALSTGIMLSFLSGQYGDTGGNAGNT
jgi:hypothetical protein